MLAQSRRITALLLLAGCATAGSARHAAAPRAEELRFEEWSDAAFDRARRERRILLLSVQATWCHWCHVMNEETYGDPEVRALLEESFVTVRVDADARPDLAERYARWA